MKEIGVISWKLPPHEMSCQHFRENNHVYSMLIFTLRYNSPAMKKTVANIFQWKTPIDQKIDIEFFDF